MRILLTADKPFARAIKLSEALIKAGHRVTFLTEGVGGYAASYMKMGSFASFTTQEEYIKQLKMLRGEIDIVVAQNFQSWHGYVAKRAFPDLPVIFDIQDSARTIHGEPEEAEDVTIAEVDGITLLCDFYKDIPGVRDKPHMVWNSHIVGTAFPKVFKPQVDAILYEGAANGMRQAAPDNKWGWRDFRSVCAHLADNGVPVFLMVIDPNMGIEYMRLGGFALVCAHGDAMLEEMTAYSWGICGYDTNGKGEEQKQGYLPNKLFEYIAAGLPVISYNTKAIGEFVTKHDVGVVCETKDDIVKVFNDKELQKRLKKNVMDKRFEFTMENQIDDIVSFYETVIRSVKEKNDGGEQDVPVSADVSGNTKS